MTTVPFVVEEKELGTITLTIDGRKVQAPKGVMVLKAALDAGIYIPNLC